MWEDENVRGTVLWLPSWLGIQASEEPLLHDSHKHCPHWGHSPKHNSPARPRISTVSAWTLGTHSSHGHLLCLIWNPLSKGRSGEAQVRTQLSLKLEKGKGRKGILRGFHFIPWDMAASQSAGTFSPGGRRTPPPIPVVEQRPASQLLHGSLPNLQRLNHLPKETLPWNTNKNALQYL